MLTKILSGDFGLESRESRGIISRVPERPRLLAGHEGTSE